MHTWENVLRGALSASSSSSSLLLVVENKYKNDIYFGFTFVYVLTTCEDLDFFKSF